MNAAQVDYTKPHPRTALWWIEREQCKRCANFGEPARYGGTSRPLTYTMSCSAARRDGNTACIQARDRGSICGPEAKLFKAKETT